MLTLGKTFFDFREIVRVSRLAVNVVWILKPWNYLEVKCVFLHGLGLVMVWGWSDFVPSNFGIFVFNMAYSLSRKFIDGMPLELIFRKPLKRLEVL